MAVGDVEVPVDDCDGVAEAEETGIEPDEGDVSV